MDAAQKEIAALERLVGPQGNSPLFARLADLYLQAGRPKDALRVCDAGLGHFPFYTTGHFVKGRTLLALEMTNEARRELEFVRDWLPTNPTIWGYLDSLPIDEEQQLTIEPEAVAEVEVPAAEPEAFAPAPAEPESNFFSAITDSEAPTSAVDTAGPTDTPAVSNVFGLPSEVPSGFGGFGGFGGSTETPASEAEAAPETFGGFSGFGGSSEPTAVESADAFGATAEEPSSTYEETVTNALGGGAPGFVATEPGESFDAYADRLRLELGPTGIITLDQFLDGDGIVPTDSFGNPSGSETVPELPVVEAAMDTPAAPAFEEPSPAGEVAAPADGFDAGSFPSFPETTEPATQATEEPFTGSLDLSGFPSAEEPAAPPAEAAPSTDDGGFSGPSFDGPPPSAPDTSIEGLAAKLQSPKKITPVIDFSSRATSDDEGSTMASSSFVTPTLAEIYAKQGWYDDAIKAYRTLAKTKPAEREKYEERIKELEEEKNKQG